MEKINMNIVAETVTLKEGGSESINIGQVKEVLRLFLELLAEKTDEQVTELVSRYRR